MNAEKANDILNKLDSWGKAYPPSAWLPLTDEEREWIHKTRPGMMDRIAAEMGRHIASCMAADLEALRAALTEHTEARVSLEPCDCGCGRSCCGYCGNDLGFVERKEKPDDQAPASG